MNEIDAFLWASLWLVIQLAATGAMKFLQPSAGVGWALGSRDREVENSVTGARAERASRNLVETFAIFAGLTALLVATGKSAPASQLGALLYLAGRVVYFFVYLMGVPYLRTLVWAVSIAGLVMMGLPLLG